MNTDLPKHYEIINKQLPKISNLQNTPESKLEKQLKTLCQKAW